jgi:predicted nucleic acid-binding protein
MTHLVIDASAMADQYLRSSISPISKKWAVHAPALIDFEFMSVLRRRVRQDELSPELAEALIGELATFSLVRHEAVMLLPRIWALRHNFTAYDGSYVALAQALGAPLMTSDRRLARAAADHCDVIEV